MPTSPDYGRRTDWHNQPDQAGELAALRRKADAAEKLAADMICIGDMMARNKKAVALALRGGKQPELESGWLSMCLSVERKTERARAALAEWEALNPPENRKM